MNTRPDKATLVLWSIGPAFLAVGAYLAFAAPRVEIPQNQVRTIPVDQIKRGAWRTPLTDPAQANVAGAARPCSECHKLFTPSPVETRTLVQHKDVVMRHGMNTRCFNCHHAEERDKLVLHDGNLVGFDQTPKLCSQCHGTVYRDWQRGTHGKTMGSWDASSGNQVRLTCNECHDPHAPAYRPIAPLPGPETMRMGDQTKTHEPERKHAPLLRWSTPGHGVLHDGRPEKSEPGGQDQPARGHEPKGEDS
jgi:hypothetical protein